MKISSLLKLFFSLLILFSILTIAKQVSAGCSGTVICYPSDGSSSYTVSCSGILGINSTNCSTHAFCGNDVKEGSCTWIDPPPAATNTPVPPSNSGGSCNSSCGTCGWKYSNGNCGSDNSCCHRTCQNYSCKTVFGSGSNECNGENSTCGNPPSAASPTPTRTPTPTLTVSGPTATPVPGCLCNTDNTCAAVCVFDKFAAPVTYPDPIKCSLSDSLFATASSTANKTSWCQAAKRTKGDADGNGIINNADYFYYVAAVNGGKIPATVNPDFNGDGEVGASDRAIIIKSLNP